MPASNSSSDLGTVAIGVADTEGVASIPAFPSESLHEEHYEGNREMLIVPAEFKFDSRNLPLGTIILFLLCTLIFFLYQSGDSVRVDAALTSYSQNGLIEYEQPLLRSWLASEGHVPGEELEDAELAAVLNVEFDDYVRDYWQVTTPADEWTAARERFEAIRNRISWLRFGLVPADVKPAALLGHMFLHGDVMHLLGNMIFLVLFGLLLERVLGTVFFVGAYVVTGLLAAALFIVTHAGSATPLVGASGAISGLMGAYLGVYGLRRVRFFYTVGFWFGKFTAPALLVFPLWLAKELYGHFSGDGPIAYMAHAGGLLGGLLIAALLKKQAARTLDVDETTSRTGQLRQERLWRIRQLMTDLHLDEAVRLTEQSIRQSPAEADYWKIYAEIASRLTAGSGYHRIMATIFTNAGKKSLDIAFLRETLNAYRQRTPDDQNALQGVGGAGLARRFFREGCSRDLDGLLDGVSRASGMSQDFAELLNTLLQVAEQNGDQRRARRYRQYLASLQPAAAGQTAADPS